MSEMNNFTGLEIAVIGIGLRFPGAKNKDEFWNNLKNGIESIKYFTDEELEAAGVPKDVYTHPQYVKARGVLEDVEYFDADFFDFTPHEAKILNPQSRFCHICCYEALEDAGYDPSIYKGDIGLFVGSGHNFFWEISAFSELFSGAGQFAEQMLIDKDFISTKVAYKLNLTGPAISMFSACSTGLVAIYTACQALLGGECEMALAGAGTIEINQKTGYMYQEDMVLSPDGHCRSFDMEANGFADGNGLGVVLLKRLDDAIADNDQIYAVIKGAVINNDGNRKIGYTAPSIEGQSAVIRAALQVAEVPADSITFVEAHGSGTKMGDPIEFAALTRAFNTDKKQYCKIGSVKTNFGHLDTGAGIAGFIKTVLSLKNKQIPPSLHFKNPNPKIDFLNSPFIVNSELVEWDKNGYPRRAGVNSIGIGGTNAHIILEEASPPIIASPGRSHVMLMLSAKTETALDAMSVNLAQYIKNNPDKNLADIAYTLQVGRRGYDWRRMVVASNPEDACDALLTDKGDRGCITSRSNKSIVFMFPGQGGQYLNMGLDLYKNEKFFRENLDKCFDILIPLLGKEVKDVLFPSDSFEDAEKKMLQTHFAQPLIFSIEYSLAKLLMEWGIKPKAMIGYSFGEYTAACISGVISLKDALELIVKRGQLMKNVSSGIMVSVPLTEKEVLPYLNDNLSLSIINGPSCIVAGNEDAITAFELAMKKDRIIGMRITGTPPAHSKEMDTILGEFEEEVKKISFSEPKIPYISDLTGTWINNDQACSVQYWVRHMRETVRFADGINELKKDENSIFIEIGPGVDLSVLLRRFIEKNPKERIINTLRHPQKEISDIEFLLGKIGRLWLLGSSIDWKTFYKEETRLRISLPTYPFDYKYFWIKEKNFDMGKINNEDYNLDRQSFDDWFYFVSWKRSSLPLPDKESGSHWLIFLDNNEMGTMIAEKLMNEHQSVTLVNMGGEYAKISDNEFVINPGIKNHYRKLFNELYDKNVPPLHILHLFSLTDNEEPGNPKKLVDNGFYSLIYLAQALGDKEDSSSIRLTVISNHVLDALGDETIVPEKSMVRGPIRVFPVDYPGFKCSLVDISFPEKMINKEKLIDNLIAESRSSFADPIIAYRGKHRLVEDFVRFPLRGSEDENVPYLKEKGVYLITGGMGDMGLTMSEYLARSFKAKLILTKRSSFPDRSEWESYLSTNPFSDSNVQSIKMIKEIEKLGSEVLVFTADVTNMKAMSDVIMQAEEKFGPINGVIHAAGIAEGGVTQIKTKKDFDTIINPKVKGVYVLESLFKNKDIDFLILFSSMSSIEAEEGQVAYSGANNFLDAYALKKSALEKPFVVSITWDAWRNIGIGVKARREVMDRVLSKIKDLEVRRNLEIQLNPYIMAKDGITELEGMEVFKRIFFSDFPRVIVSTRSVKARLNPHAQKESEDAAEWYDVLLQKVSELNTTKGLENRSNTPYVAPKNKIQEEIASIWCKLLGINALGINDDFFELGADSLIGIQAAYKLKNVGYNVRVGDIFQYRTVKQLAGFVEFLKRRENLISNPETAEKKLFEVFGNECRICHYVVDKENYFVLFIHDTLFEKKDEIASFIGKNFFESIHPHYILPMAQMQEIDDSNRTIDAETFSKIVSLKKANAFWYVAKKLGTLKSEEQKFHKSIFNGPVSQIYPVSSIQRVQLEVPPKVVSAIVYFDRIVNYESLKKAIHRIISEQGLLRSVFIKEGDEFFVKEFQTPGDIFLPYIDLSEFKFEIQQNMLREIILKHNNIAFEVRLENFNYKLLLVKLNMSRSILFFLIDHANADFFSVDDWKRYIEQYYDNDEGPLDNALTYKDFAEQIAKGPQNISADEAISFFHLDAFKRSFDKCWEIAKSNKDGAIGQFELVVPFSNFLLDKGEEGIWEIAFVIFCNFCQAVFNINEIPLSITYHGRVYEDKRFWGIIGEFISPLPVLIHMNEENPESMVAEIKLKIDTAAKHNINFFHFLVDRNNLKDGWEKVVPMITNEVFKAPVFLTFNFLGKVEKEEKEFYKRNEMLAGGMPENAAIEDVQMGLHFEVVYTEEDIRFLVINSLGLDMTEIKEILEQQADMFLTY